MTNAESEAQESLSKFFDSDKHRAFVAPPNVVWDDETQTVLPEVNLAWAHRAYERISKGDRLLIKRALEVYRRAHSRDWSRYHSRNHWSRKYKTVPAADWENRYPIEFHWYGRGDYEGVENCTVWRSNAGTTVILRDDQGNLVASYAVSQYGRLTRIH
jgi:hypothetical protein